MPARRFLGELGERLGRPRAILVASAHWCTVEPVVGTSEAPDTVHDFGDPAADVPLAQLSIQPERDPAHHWRIGRALRALREEGVLIVGSGTFTHNLAAAFRVMRQGGEGELPFTAAFVDWFAERVAAGATADLLAYRDRAPLARENHPTDEHFSFFVALGAGTEGKAGERLHHSTDFGIAMDAYALV